MGVRQIFHICGKLDFLLDNKKILMAEYKSQIDFFKFLSFSRFPPSKWTVAVSAETRSRTPFLQRTSE